MTKTATQLDAEIADALLSKKQREEVEAAVLALLEREQIAQTARELVRKLGIPGLDKQAIHRLMRKLVAERVVTKHRSHAGRETTYSLPLSWYVKAQR